MLSKVVDMIDKVPMEDRDTKGDLYDYILGKIATVGQNGQFRTPRHIIRFIVEMVEPEPTDVVCDPAGGTCGFLVASASRQGRSMQCGQHSTESDCEDRSLPKYRSHTRSATSISASTCDTAPKINAAIGTDRALGVSSASNTSAICGEGICTPTRIPENV
jgi:hypothetical protein